MKIKLITKEQYNDIAEVQKTNDILTFNNKGYEYINPDKLTLEDTQAHKKVSDILKLSIGGFREFNNFQINKDGNVRLRFQYNYNHDTSDLPFTGVGYILLDELLNGFKD